LYDFASNGILHKKRGDAMLSIMGQLGIVVIIFFLVFVLALQIQITTLSREVEDIRRDG